MIDSIAINQILILFLQCFIVAALILFLFRLRTIFGLSLLFIALGVFQYMQVFLAAALYVKVLPDIMVTPGSMVMFTGSLFAVLLIYIREDALEARKVIYALLVANIVLALLQVIFSWVIDSENVINIYNLPKEFFLVNSRVLLVGTIVLFIDAFLVVFIYEAVSRYLSSLFIRILTSMILIVSLDSLLFSLGAFAGTAEFSSILVSGLLSKVSAAIIYSALFSIYLIYIEKGIDKHNTSGKAFEDVFYTLTYRQKYEQVSKEKKIKELELQKSEEYNRLLFDTSPTGLALCDMNGLLIDINPAYAKILGRTIDETLNLSYWDVTPDKYSKQEALQLKSLEETGKFGPYEKEYIHKKGHLVPVLLNGLIIERGGNKYIWSSVEDITERKQAEEILKATNQQLNANIQQLRATEQQLTASNQELKKALEELNVQNSKVSFLYNLSMSINKSVSIDDAIEQTLEQINSIVKPYNSFFFIKNNEELNLKQVCPYNTINAFDGVETHKVGECICGLSVSQNKALYSKNIHEDLRCTWDECKEAGLKSFAALPLRYEDQVFGLIGISSKEERDFEKESEFLETVSELISTALTKTKLLQNLKNNETRLKEAELIANMGNFTWDINTGDVIWSDGLHALLGYDKSEKIDYNKVNAEIHHPDDLERITAWLNECIASGKTNFPPNEYRLLNKDGKIIQVQTTIKVLFQDNLPFKIIGTVHDITERKQSEEALKESELKFQKIISESLEAISVVDEEGKIIVWNTALEKITGIKSTETVDRYIWDVQAELVDKVESNSKRKDEIKSTLLDILKTGKAPWLNKVMEREYVHTDGTKKIVSGSMYTIKTQKGYLIVSISEDVTERKQAEEALKEAHSNLQALLDNRRDSIWALDRNYNFLVYNKPYADVIYNNMGIRLEKGMNALEIHPKEVNDYWKPKFDEVFNGNYVTFEFSYVLDGKEHFFEVYMNPIYTDNKVSGLSALSMDITQRKQAEQEILLLNKELEQRVKDRTYRLQASNKELEAFAYSVSHDLRAPLRAIDGFTRILMEDYVEKLDDEGNRLGSVIQKNAQKMGKLIDDLLAFSRLGRAAMQFSGIDMNNLANATYYEATNASERKRIKFSVVDLPDAYGDTNMMRQVWMNLITNAIKFSSKKEKVLISITGIQDDEKITYKISDNGVGFDMQYVNKIFDVFQRLHTDKEYPGTGVGLSIVQRIINRHKGKIWAESEVDKGATFYFSLPLKRD